METKFEELNQDDKEQLTNAPVWIALLAAYSTDGEISKKEKASAIRLAHVKTFSGSPRLNDFYKMVNEKFEEKFEQFQSGLPENDDEREQQIRTNVKNCLIPMVKLENSLAVALAKSFKGFYQQIFTSDSTVVSRFLLPIITTKLNMEELDGIKTSTN